MSKLALYLLLSLVAVNASSVSESEYGTVSEGHSSTYSEPDSEWSYDPGDGGDYNSDDSDNRRRSDEVGGEGGLLTQE